MFFKSAKLHMPSPEHILPGRATEMPLSNRHLVLGNPLRPPFPEHLSQIVFAMGCFWGVERKFWQLAGVYSTAVGYTNGMTPNPSYDELCTGLTGHTEAVLVVFDPQQLSYLQLLQVFWESHDPTQGMRQGNDVGTQYRSGIYTFDEQQLQIAETSRIHYQACLTQAGLGKITTEIVPLKQFYYAEEYHQQYLAKNPNGYCGLAGCNVRY